jgi:hypothetical protein
MAKKTLQSRYRDALEKQGWVIIEDWRGYKGYAMYHPDERFKYFIGRGGSVRYGTNKVNSVPASLALKKSLLSL